MSQLNPKGVILKASDFQIAEGRVYINSRKINNKPGMLLIFANWCGHCHRFMGTFNDISDSIGKNFVCTSIESEQLNGNENLSSALNFRYFPTIKFFDQHGSIISDYPEDMKREKKDVLNYICKVYHHCVSKH